jgi:hypothetical protein
MERVANVGLLTIFISREAVFRFLPPALAAMVVLQIIPAPIREKKIRGINVPPIAIIVFAILATVWHFTIAVHPGWRAGWYTE